MRDWQHELEKRTAVDGAQQGQAEEEGQQVPVHSAHDGRLADGGLDGKALMLLVSPQDGLLPGARWLCCCSGAVWTVLPCRRTDRQLRH